MSTVLVHCTFFILALLKLHVDSLNEDPLIFRVAFILIRLLNGEKNISISRQPENVTSSSDSRHYI